MKRTPGNWLIAPAFDLLLVANVGWIAGCVAGFAGENSVAAVSFWQVYFLTVPHRWLSLFLAATPGSPLAMPRVALGFIMVLAAGIVGLATLEPQGLWILVAADFVWSAWHYGAQHAGVWQLYLPRASRTTRWMARALHVLVACVVLRIGGEGWLRDQELASPMLAYADALLLAGLACVCLAGWLRGTPSGASSRGWLAGGPAYLTSVCGLYACWLICAGQWWLHLATALGAASALFHATEYFAVLSCSAWQHRVAQKPGRFGELARDWLFLLAATVLGMGLASVACERWLSLAWLPLNLWSSLVHYACDHGLWRRVAQTGGSSLLPGYFVASREDLT